MKQKDYKELTNLRAGFFEKINKTDNWQTHQKKEQRGAKLKDSETSRKNITKDTKKFTILQENTLKTCTLLRCKM